MHAIAKMLALALTPALGIWGVPTQPVRAGGDGPKVTFVPAKALLSDIAKVPGQEHGIALMSYLKAPGYSAEVVRRTRAGSAEVHESVDDIWYVIDGGATLVTGGSLVGGRGSGTGELRGRSVSGGTARPLGKGDFIGIPAGVPHWVSRIAGSEIVYLVVKVKAPGREQ